MTSTDITTIRFHGANLLVQPGDSPETTLVAMKPVAEAMGLAWQPQHRKLSDHPVLGATVTEMMMVAEDGRARAMTAIPLNRLHFWMATIHPNKIADASIRDKVIIFQTEAADALFERFFGAAIHSPVSANDIGRRVAAIVDDKLKRALTTLLPDMIEARLEADERAVAIGYKPALAILVDRKVPTKRRRAFSQRVSSRLRRFSTTNGHPMRISRESGRYLFHVDAINGWLASEGEGLIREHVASLNGQGVLRLVPASATRA